MDISKNFKEIKNPTTFSEQIELNSIKAEI